MTLPTGRPPTLGQTARVLPDGTRLSRAEVVTRGLRLGLDVIDACTAAGIDKVTYLNWKKAGAAAHAKAARGERLSDKERRYAAFLSDLERAQVEFEELCLGIIHRAGEGGMRFKETRTVTRRDRKGQQVTEVIETEKVTMPSWQAKAWLLERRRPEKYRRRVELTGAEGRDLIPPERRAEDLAKSFEDYLEAQDAEAERARSTKS